MYVYMSRSCIAKMSVIASKNNQRHNNKQHTKVFMAIFFNSTHRWIPSNSTPCSAYGFTTIIAEKAGL